MTSVNIKIGTLKVVFLTISQKKKTKKLAILVGDHRIMAFGMDTKTSFSSCNI